MYEYRTKNDCPLLVFWQHGPIIINRDKKKPLFLGGDVKWYNLDPKCAPNDSFELRGIAFAWKGAPLKDPVWVDLMTGWVYELPDRCQVVHRCGIDFVEVPSYDSPCLVTERAALDLMK